MSSATVDANGVRSFTGRREDVFRATVGALRTMGYGIAFTDPGFTVIKTEPMVVFVTASNYGETLGYGYGYRASYQSTSTSTSYSRSYGVTLAESEGNVVVRAAPRMFANGQDISATQTWTLDGPNGERAQWARLFREIASNLAVTAAAPASSAPPPEK